MGCCRHGAADCVLACAVARHAAAHVIPSCMHGEGTTVAKICSTTVGGFRAISWLESTKWVGEMQPVSERAWCGVFVEPVLAFFFVFFVLFFFVFCFEVILSKCLQVLAFGLVAPSPPAIPHHKSETLTGGNKFGCVVGGWVAAMD